MLKDGAMAERITLADISELKKAVEELKEYEAQYAALFANMADIYYKTDVNGCIEVISPSCLSQTGYTQEELLDRPVTEFYADPAQRDDLLRELLEKGKVNDFDVILVHKDGSPRDASVTSHLLLDKDEKPAGVEGILRNVTRRKQVETLLRNSEARLNAAERIAHLGSWEMDVETGRLEWSEEMFRIFETDRDSFGASYAAFLEAIHPDDREAVNNAYTHSLETRQPYGIEHRLLFPDGRIKWVYEQCESTFSEDGTPLRSLGTVQDITERKLAAQTEFELLQQNRDLVRQLMRVQEEDRRMLARDLHDELGQLLTSIMVRAEYIVRHADDAEICVKAGEIVRDTKASFDAEHAMLLKLRPATLDALGLAAALTEMADRWEKQTDIVCSLRIEGEIDHLDETHTIAIYRLVQEALTNAHRHGKATRVEVVVRNMPPHAGRKGKVLVEISNNGKGLRVQHIHKGMGIIGMRERIHALGGTFLLTDMPRDGVRIEAELPIEDGG